MAITKKDIQIKGEFPILQNRNVIYLDNAATSQKPPCVNNAVSEYYTTGNANPMRGLYELSVDATNTYEEARAEVARFINAKSSAEIIFTRNATESLNLAAYSLCHAVLKPDDEILISVMEHHSNMLPWREMAGRIGAKVRYIECDSKGEVTPEMLESAVNDKTRIICHTQMSNVFGREYDVKAFAEIAHRNNAYFVCDGSQSVPHIPVSVQDLDVDFLAFSGHKMFAPMGIGVLYGKRELLDIMPPFLHGGEMIEYVTLETVTYADVPHKFEAGTVNVGGAVGLREAIHFMERFGLKEIGKREEFLTRYTMERMADIPNVHILGAKEPEKHHGIITFVIDGVHPHDVAEIFNSENIAVRAGHHCAQPLHKFLGSMSTTRASLAFYNNVDDMDRFLDCLSGIRKKMGY